MNKTLKYGLIMLGALVVGGIIAFLVYKPNQKFLLKCPIDGSGVDVVGTDLHFRTNNNVIYKDFVQNILCWKESTHVFSVTNSTKLNN